MSGPMPGTRCGACDHDQVAQINALIEEGRLSGAKIARMFGLAKDQVNRHKFKRHPGVVVAQATLRTHMSRPHPPGQALPPDAGEVDRLKKMRQQLEDDMEARARPETARELRQINQRIAELSGENAPKRMTVRDVEGLEEQIRRWFEALEPFPDARDAMMAATDPALLGEGDDDDGSA